MVISVLLRSIIFAAYCSTRLALSEAMACLPHWVVMEIGAAPLIVWPEAVANSQAFELLSTLTNS